MVNARNSAPFQIVLSGSIGIEVKCDSFVGCEEEESPESQCADHPYTFLHQGSCSPPGPGELRPT